MNKDLLTVIYITSNKEDESLTPPYSPYVDHYDLNDKIVNSIRENRIVWQNKLDSCLLLFIIANF